MHDQDSFLLNLFTCDYTDLLYPFSEMLFFCLWVVVQFLYCLNNRFNHVIEYYDKRLICLRGGCWWGRSFYYDELDYYFLIHNWPMLTYFWHVSSQNFSYNLPTHFSLAFLEWDFIRWGLVFASLLVIVCGQCHSVRMHFWKNFYFNQMATMAKNHYFWNILYQDLQFD